MIAVSLQFIQNLQSLLQTAQHALSSEDVNTIFFKVTNLHLIHKEFVCDVELVLSDQPNATVIIGPAFQKLVSTAVISLQSYILITHSVDWSSSTII